MRKTVLFFLLILGAGISLISKVEAYTFQEETVCIDKITEYNNDCLALNTKVEEYYKNNQYAEVFTYGEQQLLCVNQMEKYVKQHPACADFGKQVVDGNYKVLMKRMTLTNYMVDLSCKNDYGKYSVGHTGANLCDCIDGYIWNNDQTSCIAMPSIDGELQEAITWMYNQGLTSFKTISSFMGEDYLTREQASKFFVQFGKKVLGKIVDSKKEVKLGDLKKANNTLQSYIKEANQLGLFKGVNGNFLPFNKLTRAQAIAVIIRANNGLQDETQNQWYKNYYNIVNNYGMLAGLGFYIDNLDSTNIKRKEVALLLYRLNKYILSDDSSIKSCQNTYGQFSNSEGIENSSGTYDCTCKEGYGFNKDQTKCIEATDKTPCQETFGKYSYTDWTLDGSGGYSCLCQEGYDRESDAPNSPCIKK